MVLARGVWLKQPPPTPTLITLLAQGHVLPQTGDQTTTDGMLPAIKLMTVCGLDCLLFVLVRFGTDAPVQLA